MVGLKDMSIKWLRFIFVNLLIICALVISFQEVAQASALLTSGTEDIRCRALLPQCFPPGHPMREKLIRDGFKVPDEKIPKTPEISNQEEADEESSPVGKPRFDCGGLPENCPPFTGLKRGEK
ncbi:hypothetical protein [Leptolyngbya ohadii]|uniref:hypothetical protein n=1 Tax=Leptolyngbya ohadii TaxID=1962290 RepID=UPI000B59D935|nr:hypothetical protein [Leptolyngbya ohadii]